jgi:hypothetical protein
MKTPRRALAAHGPAALWASAFVLAGLVLTQAATLPIASSQSVSGTVSSVEDLTILTASTGAGEDVVLVLDDVSDSLFVYGVKNRAAIELVQSYDIGRLFTDARRGAGLAKQP